MHFAGICRFFSFSNSPKTIQSLPLPEDLNRKLPNFESYPFSTTDVKARQAWIARLAATPAPLPSIKPFPKVQYNVVSDFFPGLAHQFYKSFLFNSPNRPVATAYESQCLIATYLHLFNMLFIAIRLLLKMAQNTQQAMIATTLAISTATVGLWLYLKFRKGPSHIDFCERVLIDRLPAPLPLRDYTRAKCVKRLIVHGPRGIGKSAWLDGLMAEHLKDGKKVFKIVNSLVFVEKSPGYGSTAERFLSIIDDAMSDPENTVIVCDEFGDATVGTVPNPDNLKKDALSHLNQISKALKPASGLTFIGVMQDKQWEAIKNGDRSLADRFSTLHFKKPEKPEEEDAQVLAVLNRCLSQEAPSIPVPSKGLEAILAQSNKTVEPDEGKFRKAVDLLREMISWINRNKEHLDVPRSLEAARQAYLKLEQESLRIDSPLNDPSSSCLQEYEQKLSKAKAAVEVEEKNFDTLKRNVATLVHFQDVLASKLQEGKALAQAWRAMGDHDSLKKAALEKRIDYLYHPVKKVLEDAIRDLKSQVGALHFEIDEAAVQQFALLN